MFELPPPNYDTYINAIDVWTDVWIPWQMGQWQIQLLLSETTWSDQYRNPNHLANKQASSQSSNQPTFNSPYAANIQRLQQFKINIETNHCCKQLQKSYSKRNSSHRIVIFAYNVPDSSSASQKKQLKTSHHWTKRNTDTSSSPSPRITPLQPIHVGPSLQSQSLRPSGGWSWCRCDGSLRVQPSKKALLREANG